MTFLEKSSEFTTPSVGAAVVFFYPDTACIARANRLADAGLRVVVVDNTPTVDGVDSRLPAELDAVVTLISNRANLGIATALNQGIDSLVEAKCEWAFLFDQDSEPTIDLLSSLPLVAEDQARKDPTVALVGPAYDDPRLGGVTPFVRFRPFKLERVIPEGDQPVDVDFLISSGSCLNLQCWERIGPMDDALFIDFVDLEWCVRARYKGFRVLGIPWMTMRHELGGEPLVFLGRRYPSHSASRHYYLFRNAVVLCLRGYVPWSWKSTELVKMPVRLVLYGLFFKPRMLHLKMALKGIVDAFQRKMGPYIR